MSAPEITAFFVGDICLKGVPSNEMVLESSVREMVERSDVVCCNFEGPIRCDARAVGKAGPTIQQHGSSGAFLRDQGFNVFGLANNHIMDFGPAGLEATIAQLGAGRVVGAGESVESAYRPLVVEKQGIRVGLHALCEAEFGVLPVCFGEGGAGFAWVNDGSVEDRLRRTRREVDALVVLVHAGVEEVPLPQPEWRLRYRQLVDAGADCVIAHHPHVPQGMELWHGKPIYYSLGNFRFPLAGTRGLWNVGLGVTLRITKSGLLDAAWVPFETGGARVRVSTNKRLQTYLERLNALLLDDEAYMAKWSALATRLWTARYERYYLASTSGVTNATGLPATARIVARRLLGRGRVDPLLLLHNIRIESHRYAVCRYLEMVTRGERGRGGEPAPGGEVPDGV